MSESENSTLAQSAEPAARAHAHPKQIGPYRILEVLGEGGMGIVFKAEQLQPIKRLVAIKVVKLGMDTKEVIARFEAERQALAMMNHPHVARVYDAGMTDQGRAYFVMELVQGESITAYCDRHKLTTRQRLELFSQACQAVQHAHQKAILHRDIKPSNVLVTVLEDQASVKVIDFGVAKALTQKLTERTLFTEHGVMIGTPEYMSPEQAEMSALDVDTRTDIYSLGVLLYELLTSALPFDAKTLRSAAFVEMQRIIRETDPPRPSTRLSTLGDERQLVAARHATDFNSLVHELRRELEWIPLKAMRKDRTQRYRTASELADDIGNYLAGRPLLAGPESFRYRAGKFIRRNKGPVIAASAVGGLLTLAVIALSISSVMIEHQRNQAIAARKQAQENFDQARAAVSDILAVSDEDLYDLPGMQPLRVKLMKAAIDRYKPFLDRPSTDPAPRAELARLYVKYGFTAVGIGADFDTVASPAYDAACTIQEQLLKEHPNDRALRSDLAWTYEMYKWGGFSTPFAKEIRGKDVPIFEALVAEDASDPLVRLDLARVLYRIENSLPASSEAYRIACSQRALAIREQLAREFPHSAEVGRDLGNSLSWIATHFEHDPKTSLDMLKRATDVRAAAISDMRQNLPESRLPLRPRDSEAQLLRPTLFWMNSDLAASYARSAEIQRSLKQLPQALESFDRAVAIYQQLAEGNPSERPFIRSLSNAFDQAESAARAAGQADGARARRKAAAEFWAKLADRNPGNLSIASETLYNDRSPLIGGDGGTRFASPAGPNEIFVGLRIGERKLGDDTVISFLQPVFRNAQTANAGPQHGRVWESPPVQAIARDGYAVAGLIVNPGADETAIHGLKLIFMRIDGSKLNPVDAYESDWFGIPGPPAIRILGDGTFVAGIRGRDGDWIDAVGLLSRLPSIGNAP